MHLYYGRSSYGCNMYTPEWGGGKGSAPTDLPPGHRHGFDPSHSERRFAEFVRPAGARHVRRRPLPGRGADEGPDRCRFRGRFCPVRPPPHAHHAGGCLPAPRPRGRPGHDRRAAGAGSRPRLPPPHRTPEPRRSSGPHRACGFTEEGLPVGLQVIGPHHADDAVLRAATVYEGTRGGTRVGPLSRCPRTMCRARFGRGRPVLSAVPLFGANGGRVDDRRGPVHLAPGPEFVQHRPVQPTPQAGLGPYREAAMRGGGDVPNVGGRCRQAQPLVSTYTTAVNTARSSRGAVPPPSSGTRRFDRSAPTTGIMPHEHQVT